MSTDARTRFVLVVNPTAGRGRGARVGALARRRLDSAGVSCRVLFTERPDDARSTAAAEAGRSACIVAVGGDGTVHEVGRGLIESGESAVLGILPAGTGNDYARAVGISGRTSQALESLLHGQVRTVDYGCVQWDDETGTAESIFLNVAGIGFDAIVAGEAAHLSALPGIARYGFAAIASLPSWKGLPVRVTEGFAQNTIMNGTLFLMSVGNGATAGGGFRLTPDANVSDGWLDACIVRKLSAWRALALLPLAVMGRHTGAREVLMVRSRSLTIESDVAIPLHADGELLTRGARAVRIKVVPAALRVVGASSKLTPGGR